jgi:LysR family transcriptional regulator, glycine cleavage system transcriptional activator
MKYSANRHLPSFVNLVAMTTVARTRSITRAAEELFLTQSAVSRQIKDLERFVGKPLFIRDKAEVVLTVEGRRYADQVESLLNQLEELTLGLSATAANGAHLTLSSQTTFAVKWLLPRIAAFAQIHPHITVDVETHLGQPDVKRSAADLLVLFRDDKEPGWTSDYLMQGGGYPVCTPALMNAQSKTGLDALGELPLLHQRSAPNAWEQYFQDLGVPGLHTRPGPTYALLSLGLQAALAGMGVAILPNFVTAEELASGRLVRVHHQPLVKRGAYVLMIRDKARGLPAVELLRDWILKEALASDS